MSVTTADVVVVGLGGAGSATAWALARRGAVVVAIDRFGPGHARGSSHGTERIFRLGYADPVYVELAQEALPGWRDLEREAGEPLLVTTGVVDLGFPDELVELADACAAAGAPVELLTERDATARLGWLRPGGPVLWQPDGGRLHAAAALTAFARGAVRRGADLGYDEPALAIDRRGEHVVVTTTHRTIVAGTVVVTTGPWASSTMSGLVDLPTIVVTQEQVAFHAVRGGGPPVAAGGSPWPAFIDRAVPGAYGLTTVDGLVKIGEHGTGPVIDPDLDPLPLADGPSRHVGAWVAEHLPLLDPQPVREETCLYATTPDEDFIIDRIGAVVVGVGLAGHGFKFLPALGERLADLALGVDGPFNPFTIDRVARHAGPSGHK